MVLTTKQKLANLKSFVSKEELDLLTSNEKINEYYDFYNSRALDTPKRNLDLFLSNQKEKIRFLEAEANDKRVLEAFENEFEYRAYGEVN